MTRTGWLAVFVLGLGFGYGLAQWLATERAAPEAAGAPLAPVSRPAPSADVDRTGVPPAPADAQAEAAARLLRLPVLAQRQEWRELIQSVDVLVRHDGRHAARLVPYLEQAYAGLARNALEAGDPGEARRWLVEAQRRLGESGPRLLLHAELEQAAGRPQAAREHLRRIVELDPASAEQVRPRIRWLVEELAAERRGPLTLEQKIALLNEELVSDAGHAPYYALLGELYYRQGQHELAATNLEYAMQLDAALAPRLSSLLAVMRQRQGSPGLVEVPVVSHGHTLYVEAQLNASARRYRLVLDTGASLTAVSAETARALGIAVTDDLPRVQLSTARGLMQASLITLRSVRIGEASVENVQAVVLPELEGADGLLGLSFLNHFDMDINQGERKLLLSPRP